MQTKELLENEFSELKVPTFTLQEIKPSVEDCFMELMKQQ